MLPGEEDSDSSPRLLNRIGRFYSIQPRFIVPLWGIETDLDRITSNFPVVDAPVALPYDSRRNTCSHHGLLDALTILDQGHIALKDMRGSWVGAVGQNRFMSSNFLRFAKNCNGDGHRHIWNMQANVFASIAHHLAISGRKDNQNCGWAVRLPEGFDVILATQKVRESLYG